MKTGKPRDIWVFAPEVASLGRVELNSDEAHHLLRVLRVQEGDTVAGTNGRGMRFQARIESITTKSILELGVTAFEEDPRTPADIRVAIALPKSADRLEWFLEKATEIGVTEFIPLRTERSERTSYRLDRGAKVIRAALKQSKRTHLPILRELQPFREFALKDGHGWIAHCEPSPRRPFREALAGTKGPQTILIGPEGDFTPAEIAWAEENGFKSITLGDRRLRTETAGIVAAEWAWQYQTA
jgi:16S rRNA (uracil1498-N3)-methyltransferase